MAKHLIAKRLKDAMGLHTPTVGMITISSAIESRMRSLGIETQDDYIAVIDKNPGEMQSLIEAVIIPETWFFRDDIAYKRLVEYLQKINSSRNKDNSSAIRILSAPCSSGEEPYSIAMLLADHGFSKDEIKIDAIDISNELIQRARKAVYRKHSFRANDLSFMDKHFTRNGDDYMLDADIKERVIFHNENLLNDGFMPGYEIYDVIFCRNLLIYFDAVTQARVFAVLDRLLKKDGILVLGHAETSQKSAGLFEAAHALGPYINKKIIKTDALSGQVNHQPITQRKENNVQKPVEVNKVEPVADDNYLDRAFSLANEGRTAESIKMCTQYIQQDRFSSRAHYLLGLLHDTSGDSALADDYLKKALYLDPNNLEALIHLSLMAEQRGDIEDSERLRNRAERVQSRSRP